MNRKLLTYGPVVLLALLCAAALFLSHMITTLLCALMELLL